MSEKLVSIIVPVYNAASFLKRCLDSILNQTYQDIEVLIVDDGSTDGSADICLVYSKHSKVHVYHQMNQGQSAARNYALDRANGEYILFVDADDYIDEHLLEKTVLVLEKTGGDILLFDHSELTNNGIKKFEHTFEKNHIDINSLSKKEIMHLVLLNQISNLVWNKLYRRNIWDKIRFPVEFYYEDLYINPHIFLQMHRFVYLPEILYFNNRINSNSTTGLKSNFSAVNRYGKFHAWKEHEYVARQLDDMCAVDWAVFNATREAIKLIYINCYSPSPILPEEIDIVKKYLQTNRNISILKKLRWKEKILLKSIFNFPWVYKLYGYIRFNQEKMKGRI